MLRLASRRRSAASTEAPEEARSLRDTASPSTRNAVHTALRRDDWEALFRAVSERLQRQVEDLSRSGADELRQGFDRFEPLRECAAALQQLLRELDAPPAEAPALERTSGHLSAQTPFEHELARRLAAADGLPAPVLFCLGLDGFKRVNEQYGRELGDAALVIVAQRLVHALRAGDWVCRLDGDRFACLLQGTSEREPLSRLACKLFDAVASPLRVGAVTISVLPSIGIACWHGAGESGPQLLRHADAAMSRAQRRQQGYVFFDPRSDL